MARPQLDLPNGATVKNRSSDNKTVAHTGSPIWEVILHPLQQNLRDSGVDARVFGDLVGNVSLVQDVIDPAFVACIIDTKPVTENEMLVVGE